MTTYLLTWKPVKWPWKDLQDCIDEISEEGFFENRWSCGVTKKINIGDRIFFMRQGKDKPGIFGSGWATSEYYEDDHWDISSGNETALYIDIILGVLLNPESEPIYPRGKLKKGALSDGPWDTQNSGVTIPRKIASELEKQWTDFLAKKNIVQYSPKTNRLPEEVEDSNEYSEGTTKKVPVNKYERNSKARKACIQHYGLNCRVCGFNFETIFGEIGVGYIHVHHLTPLSKISKKYKLDPIKDLRPVCPNCHAMIHSKKPAYTINELRQVLQDNAK
jgi:5-methylcytosine-specific restriction protein A